jgi:hypothetical protein
MSQPLACFDYKISGLSGLNLDPALKNQLRSF